MVRGYVAVGQGHALEVISTELLFVDVTKQLAALNELVEAGRVVELVPRIDTVAAVRAHLSRVLAAVWSDNWIKAPARKRKPPAAKQGKRDHTSVYRLLNAHRLSKSKAAAT